MMHQSATFSHQFYKSYKVDKKLHATVPSRARERERGRERKRERETQRERETERDRDLNLIQINSIQFY